MELIYRPPHPKALEWAEKKFPWLGKEWIITIPKEEKMVDLSHIPTHFTEGYRGVLLIYRNKDDGEGNAQRKSIHRITRSAGEWMTAILELQNLQESLYPNHRIYSSVNARNPLTAIREYKRRQLNHDYEDIYRQFEFYRDAYNRFFSCFMNPSSRMESNFLIDCDTEEEYAYAQQSILPEMVLFQYPTKNGWHMITKPFNPNGLKLNIKKDDLLYIG